MAIRKGFRGRDRGLGQGRDRGAEQSWWGSCRRGEEWCMWLRVVCEQRRQEEGWEDEPISGLRV